MKRAGAGERGGLCQHSWALAHCDPRSCQDGHSGSGHWKGLPSTLSSNPEPAGAGRGAGCPGDQQGAPTSTLLLLPLEKGGVNRHQVGTDPAASGGVYGQVRLSCCRERCRNNLNEGRRGLAEQRALGL